MAHLTLEERYVISTGLLYGETKQEIAQRLGRHPSVIGREIRRNRSASGIYCGTRAHRLARERRQQRPMITKMETPGVAAKVFEGLEQQWSPEQISNTLKNDCGASVISHQTIYDYVWCLPNDHLHRRSLRRRGRRPRKAKPGFITRKQRDRKSIHDRPKVVQERCRTGDWELDLMTCHRGSGYLITAVERKTGYTLIRKVRSKHTSRVMDGILKMFEGFDATLMKTFTFDNGNEFYSYARLERDLGVKVYFADPYNSGQRGTNENTNGLIRQYFAKTLAYGLISHRDVKRVQNLLNERPRRRLQYRSPAAVLGKHPKIAFRI